MAIAQKLPIATANAITSGVFTLLYGAGALWKSSREPTTMLIRPDTVSAPWRRHVRVDHE